MLEIRTNHPLAHTTPGDTITIYTEWTWTARALTRLTETLMDILNEGDTTARLEAQINAMEHAATVSELAPRATSEVCQAITAAIERNNLATRQHLKNTRAIAKDWHEKEREHVTTG